jgi:hypothetical protein
MNTGVRDSEWETNTPPNYSNKNLIQSAESEKLTKDYCLMVNNTLGGGNIWNATINTMEGPHSRLWIISLKYWIQMFVGVSEDWLYGHTSAVKVNSLHRRKIESMKLTTHLHIVLRLRMSGPIVPVPDMPSWCAQEQLHPYETFCM